MRTTKKLLVKITFTNVMDLEPDADVSTEIADWIETCESDPFQFIELSDTVCSVNVTPFDSESPGSER